MDDCAVNPRNFFAELKRRNVYKVAVAYLVVAWLLIQAASIFFPAFDAPPWVMRVFIIVIIFGSPVALIFSWAFEITPEGIKLESEIDPNKSITWRTGRKIVAVTIALAVVAASLFVYQLVRWKSDTSSSPTTVAIAQKSIAVLPFVNMSGAADNNDFSDGITEEILNALSQISDLKVAARTSAFQFKGRNVDLRHVGETLGVAHVLEGSVQRAGDEVRITAQLIDARTGYHKWSQKYDRKLTSIFAIEDEISKAIASQMQVALGNDRGQPLVKPATADPRAHEFYLKGLARITERGAALNEAVKFFNEAIAIDPNYAAAWAGLSQASELLPWYKLAPWRTSLVQAEDAARRALSLDPQLAEAHTGLANVLRDRRNYAEATKEYRTALELNPGSAETINQYAQMLLRTGDLEAAIKQERAAIALDPLAPNPHYILGMLLGALHRYDEAIAEEKTVVGLNPKFSYAHFYLSYLFVFTGNYPEAEKAGADSFCPSRRGPRNSRSSRPRGRQLLGANKCPKTNQRGQSRSLFTDRSYGCVLVCDARRKGTGPRKSRAMGREL